MLSYIFLTLLLVSISLNGGRHVVGINTEGEEHSLNVVDSSTITVAGDFDHPPDNHIKKHDAYEHINQIPAPTLPTPLPTDAILSNDKVLLPPVDADAPTVPEGEEKGEGKLSLPEESSSFSSSQALEIIDPSPSLDLLATTGGQTVPLQPVCTPALQTPPVPSPESAEDSPVVFSESSTYTQLPEEACSSHQMATGECKAAADRPPPASTVMDTIIEAGAPDYLRSEFSLPDPRSLSVSVQEMASDVMRNEGAVDPMEPDETCSASGDGKEIATPDTTLSHSTGDVDEAAANEDLNGSTEATPSTASEDELLSFEEWKKKKEEDDAKNGHDERVQSTPEKSKDNTANGNSAKLVSVQQNFANVDCGAKVVNANPKAQNWQAVLDTNRDVYLLNPCSAKIWFVVELCDEVLLQTVEMANFEMFSSSPENFTISTSNRFPTHSWTTHGEFHANDTHDIQFFELPKHVYAKYLKIEVVSHYGVEHYCPISLIRVKATSMVQEYELVEDIEKQPDPLNVETVNDGSQFQEPEVDIVHRAKHAVLNILSSFLSEEVRNETDHKDVPYIDNKTENSSEADSPSLPVTDAVPLQNGETAPEPDTPPAGGEDPVTTVPNAPDASAVENLPSGTETEVSSYEEYHESQDVTVRVSPAELSGSDKCDAACSVVEQTCTSELNEDVREAVMSVPQPVTVSTSPPLVDENALSVAPPPSSEDASSLATSLPLSPPAYLKSDEPASATVEPNIPAPPTPSALDTLAQELNSNPLDPVLPSEVIPVDVPTTPSTIEDTSMHTVTPDETLADKPSLIDSPAATSDGNATAQQYSSESVPGGDAKAQEDASHAQSAPPKESVFIRLNNRIKSLDSRLDANVTLIQHYLDALSASFNRFKKNMSEIQRSNEARLHRINESLGFAHQQLVEAAIANQNVENNVVNLTTTVVSLAEELLRLHDQTLSHLSMFVATSIAVISLFMLLFLVFVGHRLSTACDRQLKTMELMIRAVKQSGYSIPDPAKLDAVPNGGVARSVSLTNTAVDSGRLAAYHAPLTSVDSASGDDWIPVASKSRTSHARAATSASPLIRQASMPQSGAAARFNRQGKRSPKM